MLRDTSHDVTTDQCADCHAVAPVAGDRDTLMMTAPIVELCAGCHGDMSASLSLPAEGANPVITLVEGNVGCSSCNDPYSGEQKKLVIANRGSRLCFACHDTL